MAQSVLTCDCIGDVCWGHLRVRGSLVGRMQDHGESRPLPSLWCESCEQVWLWAKHPVARVHSSRGWLVHLGQGFGPHVQKGVLCHPLLALWKVNSQGVYLAYYTSLFYFEALNNQEEKS